MKQERSSQLGLIELIAIGVGGMIGGGIFSVLGLAVEISGHAAPLAFALGSGIACAAGYSYIRLALTFQDDGASFTYLERAFPAHPNVGGIAGWTVIIGYVGTLALYAFTFGAYGAALLGNPDSGVLRMALSASVMLFFLLVNLKGVRESGLTEDLLVYTKVIILMLFGIAGLSSVRKAYLLPVLDKGTGSIFMAGALIFVAYEGFQLITNTILETRDPARNLPRGIYASIGITTFIYIVLSVVAIGNLTSGEIVAANEYALAAAARPVLGQAGLVLVSLAALLATSSAINGTVLGASRMAAEMASLKMAPRWLGLRNSAGVPWAAVLALTALGLLFTLGRGLETIAAFSSMTFLLVSLAVCVANLRLRKRTGAKLFPVLAGIVLIGITVALLLVHLWQSERSTLYFIAAVYGVVIVSEPLVTRHARVAA